MYYEVSLLCKRLDKPFENAAKKINTKETLYDLGDHFLLALEEENTESGLNPGFSLNGMPWNGMEWNASRWNPQPLETTGTVLKSPM